MPPTFYLNSYAPLVISRAGRLASDLHGLPPFIDGSIRREPDLEHKDPGISCLCRGGNFAPRLRVGDIVAYMTKKASFGQRTPQRRLTAILQVRHVFQTHREAAAWYRQRNLALPSNCMVSGNAAIPLDHSHRGFRISKCSGDTAKHRARDAAYRRRAN
jgi:hypothetical protein